MDPTRTDDAAGSQDVRGRRASLAIVLLIILACGAIPRFWDLRSTGPYFVDQGDYMLGAWWIYDTTCRIAQALPDWIRHPPDSLAGELTRIFREVEGQPMILGRPLHNLLGAVPMFFVGYRPYLGNMVSAFFGVLSLPALFLLYRMLFGPRGSLAATVLLAVMGIHVYYSRNFFPEADSTFFLLVSLVLYMQSRARAPESGTRWIASSGLAWGLAITASDRWLSMLPVLWVLEAHLLLWEKRIGWRQALVRFMTLNALALVPVLLFGMPYLLLRFLYWREGQHMPIPGYFKLLLTHFAIAQAMAAARFIDALPVSGFRLSDLLIFPHISFRYNGPLYTLFLAVGILRSLWRRERGDIVVLVCFFAPLVYLHLQVYHCMRHYSMVFPLIAILTARGLFADRAFGEGEDRVERLTRRPWLQALLIACFLVTLLSGINASRFAGRFPFGYPAAAEYARTLPAGTLATNPDVFQAYLGTKICKPSPATLEDLQALRGAGYRYLLTDFLPVIWQLMDEVGIENPKSADRLAVIHAITENREPVASFPNPGATTTDLTFEVLFHYTDAFEVAARIRRSGGDTIRVYEIPERVP